MFVVGAMPSDSVPWLALLRDAVPVVGNAPDCALPRSASLPRPPLPKLSCCRFHVFSVKPSWYEKSCMRLCATKRFARAASRSARWGVVVTVGEHPVSCHWLVQG